VCRVRVIERDLVCVPSSVVVSVRVPVTTVALSSPEAVSVSVRPRWTGVPLPTVGVTLSDLVSSNEIVPNVWEGVTEAASVFVSVSSLVVESDRVPIHAERVCDGRCVSVSDWVSVSVSDSDGEPSAVGWRVTVDDAALPLAVGVTRRDELGGGVTDSDIVCTFDGVGVRVFFSEDGDADAEGLVDAESGDSDRARDGLSLAVGCSDEERAVGLADNDTLRLEDGSALSLKLSLASIEGEGVMVSDELVSIVAETRDADVLLLTDWEPLIVKEVLLVASGVGDTDGDLDKSFESVTDGEPVRRECVATFVAEWDADGFDLDRDEDIEVDINSLLSDPVCDIERMACVIVTVNEILSDADTDGVMDRVGDDDCVQEAVSSLERLFRETVTDDSSELLSDTVGESGKTVSDNDFV
jgi:hypothetical protein